MNRKASFVLILTVLSLTASSQGQNWIWQEPLPQGNAIYDIEMLNNGMGWAIGPHAIIYTENSGATWTQRETRLSRNPQRICFFDEQAGYLLSNELDSDGWISALAQTFDGGQTWMSREWPDVVLADMIWITEQTGMLVGDSADTPYNSVILRTTNGGQTWIRALGNPAAASLSWVRFADAQYGWAGGTQILATTDGGASWEIRGTSDPAITDAQFFDAGFGLMVRPNSATTSAIWATADGGASWIRLFDFPERIRVLRFTDPLHGWAAGDDGYAAYTTDGGNSWQTQPSGIPGSLNDIELTDMQSGWFAGQWGYVARMENAGTSWQIRAGQRTTSHHFNAVSFSDAQHGWACGGDVPHRSSILRTTDGGSQWTIVREDTGGFVWEEICAVDPLTAWALNIHGTLHYTTDGGQTWNQHPFEEFFWGRMQFVTPQIGWILCHVGVARTTDGGSHWEYFIGDFPANATSIFFIDDRLGWVGGGKTSYISRTTDGGQTWVMQHQEPPTAMCFRDLWFTDRLHGWAVGIGSIVYHTDDGGLSWEPMNIGGDPAETFHRVCFTDAQHGWIISMEQGRTFYTEDGGDTWCALPTVAEYDIHDVSFVNSHRGWAVGERGTILTWDDGTLEVNPEPGIVLPQSCSLSAHPNPFNPTTTLTFSVPITGSANLTVYDLNGRFVQTLADQILYAGEYRQTFDGARLPSGIYFARLQGPAFSATQKLILLK